MNQLFRWTFNFSRHPKVDFSKQIVLAVLTCTLVGFFVFSTTGFCQNFSLPSASSNNIPKLAKLATQRLKKNPNADNYLAAAQGIQMWWASYELTLHKQISKKIPKPTLSKKIMLFYAEKSADLGNFDAANFLAIYYRTSSSKSASMKQVADCWDRVLDNYLVKNLNQQQLVKKCMNLGLRDYGDTPGLHPISETR